MHRFSKYCYYFSDDLQINAHAYGGWGSLEKDHQAINHHKVAYNDKWKVCGTFDWLD